MSTQVHGQHCIWYGECGNSTKIPEKKLNCNYTGPPIPLPDQEGQDLLKVREPLVCCSRRFIVFRWESSLEMKMLWLFIHPVFPNLYDLKPKNGPFNIPSLWPLKKGIFFLLSHVKPHNDKYSSLGSKRSESMKKGPQPEYFSVEFLSVMSNLLC